jgi:hypothetical protein
LNVLVNGIRAGGVSLRAATDVLRSWPSAYELLPRYRVVADERPDATGQAMYPHELGELDIGSSLDTNRARRAFELHQKLETRWRDQTERPDAPSVVPFIGCGHATPERVTIVGDPGRTRLQVTSDNPEWLYEPEMYGDGTVPGVSAVPWEMDGTAGRLLWRMVTYRHGPLAGCREVVALLKALSALGPAAVRGLQLVDGELPPSIGLGIDELVVAGEAVEIVAFPRWWPGDAADVVVRAALGRDGEVAPLVDVEMAWEPGRWRSRMGPLEPGVYWLTVSAPLVGAARSASDVVMVVEP